jgi:hypothetical protein
MQVQHMNDATTGMVGTSRIDGRTRRRGVAEIVFGGPETYVSPA